MKIKNIGTPTKHIANVGQGESLIKAFQGQLRVSGHLSAPNSATWPYAKTVTADLG
jgi:hypothetical protein